MEIKTQKLIELLVDATKTKKLSWETADRKNQFQIKLTSGIVRVEAWIATDEHTDANDSIVDIEVFNPKGELIDNYRFSKSDEPEEYLRLMTLHDAARRNYFQVDEFLDQLLGEVQAKRNSRTP